MTRRIRGVAFDFNQQCEQFRPPSINQFYKTTYTLQFGRVSFKVECQCNFEIKIFHPASQIDIYFKAIQILFVFLEIWPTLLNGPHSASCHGMLIPFHSNYLNSYAYFQKFLQRHGFVESLLLLEKQSFTPIRSYSKQLTFLRRIILEGDFRQAFNFLLPFQDKLNPEDYRAIVLKLLSQRLFELVQNPDEIELKELLEQDLVKWCRQDDDGQQYEGYLEFLNLNKMNEHPNYKDWTITKGRLACFQFIRSYVEIIESSLFQEPQDDIALENIVEYFYTHGTALNELQHVNKSMRQPRSPSLLKEQQSQHQRALNSQYDTQKQSVRIPISRDMDVSAQKPPLVSASNYEESYLLKSYQNNSKMQTSKARGLMADSDFQNNTSFSQSIELNNSALTSFLKTGNNKEQDESRRMASAMSQVAYQDEQKYTHSQTDKLLANQPSAVYSIKNSQVGQCQQSKSQKLERQIEESKASVASKSRVSQAKGNNVMTSKLSDKNSMLIAVGQLEPSSSMVDSNHINSKMFQKPVDPDPIRKQRLSNLAMKEQQTINLSASEKVSARSDVLEVRTGNISQLGASVASQQPNIQPQKGKTLDSRSKAVSHHLDDDSEAHNVNENPSVRTKFEKLSIGASQKMSSSQVESQNKSALKQSLQPPMTNPSMRNSKVSAVSSVSSNNTSRVASSRGFQGSYEEESASKLQVKNNSHLSKSNGICQNQQQFGGSGNSFVVPGSKDNPFSKLNKPSLKLKLLGSTFDEKAVRVCQFSPSSRYLAVGSNSSILKIFDVEGLISKNSRVESLVPIYTIPNLHIKSVFSIDWSANEKIIVSCSNDASVKLTRFNEDFTEHETSLVGRHDGSIRMVRFNGLENKIISCAEDNLIKIWDTKKPKIFQTLKGHYSAVNGIKVVENESRNLLYSVSKDCSIRLWDLRTGDPEAISKPHQSEITHIARNVNSLINNY